jgi:type IV pilus assembly protein PilN
MIRINLIAGDRDRARRRAFGAGFGMPATQQKTTLACGAILVATVLGVGLWYWSLAAHSRQIEADIVTSQKETARLRELIQQVQAFEARRAQLQLRVSLIEDLQKGRDGPVHMLDVISRSVPNLLWLTEVKQQGADLLITGRCLSLTALSDFADNLKGSGYFKPVEILESQSEQPSPGGGPTPNKFSLKATFAPPDSK